MRRRDEKLLTVRYGDPEKGTPFLGMNDTISPEKVRPGEATLIENLRINVQSTDIPSHAQKANLCKRGGTTKMGEVDYVSAPGNPPTGDWLLEYIADAVPGSAADSWSKSNPFTISEAADGILTLTATSGEEGTYYRGSLSTFDNAVGVTVRADVQIQGSGTGYFLIKIEDGIKEAEFKIYKDKIAQNSTEYVMDTTSNSVVYHLTLKENQFRAYVGGIARIVNEPSGLSGDQEITFGIPAAELVAKVDYLRYEDSYLYITDWVRSMFHYTTVTGFDELIAHTGEALFHSYDDGVTWSWLYGRLNSNYRVHAVQYLDKIYFTNGYNTLLWYDGHDVTRADDETAHDNFPKAKYLAIDENADVMAAAHMNDAPNGIRFMSIIDADGETITPDDDDAWLYATTTELEREGGITGIIHFNNCWVITQRHYLTVMTGHSPENFRKYDLRFDSGEGTGCVSQETLQIKQGYLYGAGAKKIWRWRGPGSPLEDISGDRVQNLYEAVKKPETKYYIATTEDQFSNCPTRNNIDYTKTSGDAILLRLHDDESGQTVFADHFDNPARIGDQLFTLPADSQTETSGYIGFSWSGTKRIRHITVKYIATATSTLAFKYHNGTDWNNDPTLDVGSFTCDGNSHTTTFEIDDGTNDYIEGIGLRMEYTSDGSPAHVRIYEMWSNKGEVFGKEQYIGSPDELGVFEADACTGTSGVPTVSYYVRYATTKEGLTGAWTQVWVGQRLPTNGSNTWMQWKAVLYIGDTTSYQAVDWPADGSFPWYYPTLHFVKLTWIKDGLWKNKMTAVVYNDQYLLSIRNGTGSYNNEIMIYDSADQWLKDTGKHRSAFVVAGGVLYGGDANSCNFYKDEDYSVGSDNGSAISCKWYSRQETFGCPDRQKNLRAYRVWFGSLQQNGAVLSMQITKWYDGSSTDPGLPGAIATNVATTNIFYYKGMLALGFLGEKFRFYLYNSSTHRGVEIGGLQIEAKVRTRR